MTTMGPIMGLIFAKLPAVCPACGTAVTLDRFFGVGPCYGQRCVVFRPHRAPCGLWCATAGFSRGELHTGPASCERCTSGSVEVLGSVAMVDEVGILETVATGGE